MTQDSELLARWEEILAQPVSSVREDGWQALLPLDAVARLQPPRPALAPPADWLIAQPPAHPETAGPGLPPSLAEQLSLTWSQRRQRGRRAAAASSAWPETPPAGAEPMDDDAPSTLSPRRPAWTQPLRLLRSVLGRTETAEAGGDAVGADAETEETHLVPRPRTQPSARPGSDATAPAAPQPGGDEPAEPAAPKLDSTAPTPTVRETLAHRLFRRAATRAAASNRDETPADAPSVRRERSEAGSPVAMPMREATSPADLPPAAPPVLEHRRVAAPAEVGGAGPEDDLRETSGVEAPALETSVPASSAAVARGDATEDTGEPLAPVLRERVEGLLDLRLRDVRIFRTSRAARTAHALDAEAVTIDRSVLLGETAPPPGSPAGDALIAHELAHVAAREQAPFAPAFEEQHALRLEHAVHRGHATPADVAPTPSLLASAFDTTGVASPGGAVGDLAPVYRTGAPANGAGTLTVGRAPLDRAAPSSSNHEETAPAPEALAAEPAAEGLSEEEVRGLVDRVVEAVLRRLRRDTALERERSGAFHSTIGG